MDHEQGIVFDHVSFSYDAGAPALDDVCLSIGRGEFVAVLGANGSGKSTLAKHVNALLVPSSGEVRVDGLATSDAAQALEIRRRAGMVFQNPDNQAVASIVRDDVAFGPENLGVEPAEIRRRIADALGRVGMSGHEDSDINTLSGGQKQRVAIAGVLAMQPDYLLLDEPGAMLDVRGRRGITRVAHELNAGGMTVVLVTHFMEEALGADRVIVLDHGKVALDGPPEDVFADAVRLRELRLELPFALKLAESLQARGVAVKATADEGELQEQLQKLANTSPAATREAPRDDAEPPAPAATRETLRDDAEPPAPAATRETPREGAGSPRRGGLLPARVGLETPQTIPPSTGAATPAAPAAEPRIAFEYASFAYDDAHPALDGIDFAVPSGAFVGVIGHTGSGKSTLVQLMNALLVPTEGRVLACGLDTAEKRARTEIRRSVGVAFQYPEQQLFAQTVAEDVAFGPRNLGLDAAEVERRSREALARVGLPYDEFAQRSPFGLSGGQRRRAALAGILAMEPRVLVLDEPAAGMDPQTNREVKALLRSLNEDGMTIVLVSHSMEDVAELCGHVVVLDGGRVLLQGTPSEVFGAGNAAALQEAGLDAPQAVRFARELARRGLPLSCDALTEQQLADALAVQLA